MLNADIIAWLQKEFGLEQVVLDVPPKPDQGDYAFSCFVLARKLKRGPKDIAQDIAQKFPKDTVERVEATGPFVNFTIKNDIKAKHLVKTISEKGEFFGLDKRKQGKALIEHTSTNPNAPPHIGRARNALIGDCVKRLLSCSGYEVKTHFYVNDIGKQIALLVLGCESHKQITFQGLLDIYIAINKKMKEDPSIEQQAFELLAKLENGDTKTRAQFRKVVDICVQGQAKTLAELGITYDQFDHESAYLFNGRTDEMLTLLEQQGKLFVDEDGRKVLNLEGYNLPMKNPVFVLTRGDGTSLYGLRDIAYTHDKMSWCPEHNLLVLGEDQKLYHQQIIAALDILGEKAPRPIHYSFVLLDGGKMGTRSGNVVLLSDFMKEAREKALQEIEKRGIVSENKEATARAVGYGAVKYAILRISKEKNVTFRWEDALSFEGDSGPYIQYTHARICSLINKFVPHSKDKADYTLLTTKHEQVLMRKMLEYEQALHTATRTYESHVVAQALYQLAKAFNEFYQNCPIKQAEPALGTARYKLALATKTLIKGGLYLLGIEAIERM